MKQKDDAPVPASQLTAVMNYMHKHVISHARTHARTHTNTQTHVVVNPGHV